MALGDRARLADTLLEEGVAVFIATGRAEGVSWRLLERRLYERTNGELDATAESLRAWAGHLGITEAA